MKAIVDAEKIKEYLKSIDINIIIPKEAYEYCTISRELEWPPRFYVENKIFDNPDIIFDSSVRMLVRTSANHFGPDILEYIGKVKTKDEIEMQHVKYNNIDLYVKHDILKIID